jgi:hypothetical protein
MLLEIFNKLNRPRVYLLFANFFLVFFLILFSNLGILPFKSLGDFAFFAAIALAFALYRPGWAFLFFVGAIALENINLAPESLGLMIRPYQFIGALTLLAIFIKSAAGRLGFTLPKWNWYDALFIIFAAAGFLSAIFSIDKPVGEANLFPLWQSVIALSFTALYFLARIFIQTIIDLKKIAPFFLSSGLIVVLYGIWQNIAFTRGFSHFEMMPGRPNGTFTEPDWLGIYLVLLLAIIYSVIYFFQKKSEKVKSVILNFKFLILKQFSISNFQILKLFLYIILVTSYILLILAVSRSAWLGAFAVTFAFLFITWTGLKINPKNWIWMETFFLKLKILGALLAAIALIFIFHLTNFQLFNRAQSTGTGLQKITVSCVDAEGAQKLNQLPQLEQLQQLEQFNCRHINLEEINQEKLKGNFVAETYRTDPNVDIRKEIYQKSWAQIKAHPLLGIGWGNVGNILGQDANGNALNSSNIFLEVWLGAGRLGITAFIFIWIGAIIKALKLFSSENRENKSFGLFLLLGTLAIIIPNLFNAGIFLGFLWLFFAISNIKQ